MSSATPILAARGLTKRFGAKLAVDGVDLDVGPGEIVGFLGPNGAGKTTVMTLITGLSRPDAGDIVLFGVRGGPRDPAVRSRLGYLQERPCVYPDMSARAYLTLFAALHGVADGRRRVEEAIEAMALGHAAERPLRTYSRGMQQRTCLARAMLHRPEFLVLDEPTLGLDPVGLSEMRTILLDLNRAGVALLFSSHQLAEMERIAHRVVLMNGGRVIATGPTREVVGGIGAAEAEAEVERVTPSLLAALRALPFVTGVTPVSERGLVIGLDPAAAPPGADLRVPISAAIAASGGVVLSVAHRQPSLEDAFLRLTQGAEGPGQPAKGRVVRMERRPGEGGRDETAIDSRRLGAA